MRNDRFRDLVERVVHDHPDVTGIERVSLGREGDVLRVNFTDGTQFDLMITNTSPPGGDDHSKPETVVTKERP
ncbi:hypothetical protein [Umezawaea beigongshangensis]|uniref:hypothetical protein n=1 Tax=Umezawaea beigongshangensis TaxID=2780383 RepID=UPI0018F10AA6|nr:hypothetical protein [Umezawaea beigongshangensis]